MARDDATPPASNEASPVTPDAFLKMSLDERADWLVVIGIAGLEAWTTRNAAHLTDEHRRELLSALGEAALRLTLESPPADWS